MIFNKISRSLILIAIIFISVGLSNVTAGSHQSTRAKKKAPVKKKPVVYPVDLEKIKPTLNLEKNIIQNDSLSLKSFYSKLSNLKNRQHQIVRIFHFGDSHLQNGFLTNEVRTRLQNEFGDAGRGLIFPSKFFRQDSPRDYIFSTNSKWIGYRVNKPKEQANVGIAGMMTQTSAPHSEINFRLLEGTFTSIDILHGNSEKYFDMILYDSLGQESENHAEDPFVTNNELTHFEFENPVSTFKLCVNSKTPGKKKPFVLYGMLLKTGSNGIIYNSTGVNSAKITDYTLSDNFLKQSSILNPDLIIISLGTNDISNGTTIDADIWVKLNNLIEKLKLENPSSAFLLTTPPDYFKKQRRKTFPNPNVPVVSEMIPELCKTYNIAYWDLYTVMGGSGSFMAWRLSGLASHDLVHFTKEGYQLQGELLFDALMKSYKKYQSYGY